MELKSRWGKKVLILLETLLQSHGRPVSKSELLGAAWPSETVEVSNLAVQIAALRKRLGRTPRGDEWIITIQRFGYRFQDIDDPSLLPSLAILRRHCNAVRMLCENEGH